MPPKTAQAAAASLLATLPASADPRMERRLRDLALSVELRTDVNLKDFDEEASLHNQARLGKPVNLDVVDGYAAKMRSGVVFPAIVAWDDPSKPKLLICDGNHRYQATKQAGRDTIDAYWIDGDPMAIQIFMFTVNAEHGVVTDDETKVHHALWLHDSGKTLSKAAAMMSVSYPKVVKAYNLRDAANRAHAQRINTVKFDALNAGVREALAKFKVDEVFKAITELTIAADLPADAIKKARRDLDGVRSTTKQLEYIAAMKDAYADLIATQGKLTRGRGSQAVTPRMRLRTTIGSINSLPDAEIVLGLMTPQDKATFFPKVKEAKARIDALYAMLEAR